MSNTKAVLVAVLSSLAALSQATAATLATPGTPNGGRQSAKTEVITELKTDKPEKADIGSITELARQIQIEKQRKELRELRAAGKTAAAAPAGGPALSDPINLGGQAAPARNASARAGSLPGAGAVAAPATPVILNIAGAPNTPNGLVATLDTGRKLARGDSLVVGGASWTVEGVTPVGVLFRRCASSAPAAHAQAGKTAGTQAGPSSSCSIQSIAVSSRV